MESLRVPGRTGLALLAELQLDLPILIASGATGEGKREQESPDAALLAELAHTEVDRRMRSMIEAASAGVWFSGAEGRGSFMNARMARILGLTAEEAAHASVTDFVDEAARKDVAARLAERKTGVSSSYDYEFRRKGGEARWGAFESSPLFDAEGRFEGVLTVMTDITERRKSQEAQREAELRFRRIFDSGIIGITVATHPSPRSRGERHLPRHRRLHARRSSRGRDRLGGDDAARVALEHREHRRAARLRRLRPVREGVPAKGRHARPRAGRHHAKSSSGRRRRWRRSAVSPAAWRTTSTTCSR
jgi:PAS domain S-box-containing protein